MIKIAIPNGSLYEPTIDIFSKVGIYILTEGRKFNAEVRGIDAIQEALIMRPQAIPEAISHGVADVGICGWDCVVESRLEKKLVKIEKLDYSKKSNGPVRVVVFGKELKIIDEKDILVSSEYPNITRGVFKRANIRFSSGSTEVNVANGIYDYGVGIIETGQSLSDNGLIVVKTLLVSPTIIVARERTPEIELLGNLLTGAIKAGLHNLVKMNVDKKNKDKVISILPALDSPTVERRADGSFAIETVIRKDEMANIVIALKEAGATGILVQNMNIIL